MVRKPVNVKDLELVPEEEVPTSGRRTLPWDDIFTIPRGQARVIRPEQIPSSTVREALKRCQKNGKFKNLIMRTQRTNGKKYISYIINPSKKETE